MTNINVKGVTIVGANGTMGRNIAAIFASFGAAQVYLVSRTMQKSIQAKEKAYLSVRAESIKEKMIPCTYEELEQCIDNSELIFEAGAEDWGVKEELHKKIASILEKLNDKHRKKRAICLGTSGLSITKLAELYAEEVRPYVMGMHFFNPPYQMILCEMTPTRYTESDPSVFREIKEYTREVLRRAVVETKDLPAFLGNRIGFQFINEAVQMAEKYKYNGGIDYIDAILGPFTGRSMAPLVTANFVGLDVHKAIVENLYNNTNDYAHDTYILPAFLNQLISDGKIGKKAGEGLYKTIIHDSGVKLHQVYDIENGYYRENIKYVFPFAENMIHSFHMGDYQKAFHALVDNYSQEATLCCEMLLKYILYSFSVVKEMEGKIEDADDVMATGFHWCPPLALMEAFSEICDFKQLCLERLPQEVLSKINVDDLLNIKEKSKYDYRKFMIAKR